MQVAEVTEVLTLEYGHHALRCSEVLFAMYYAIRLLRVFLVLRSSNT